MADRRLARPAYFAVGVTAVAWERMSSPLVVMRAIVFGPLAALHWAVGLLVRPHLSPVLEGVLSLVIGYLLFRVGWRFLLPVEREVRLQQEALRYAP